MLGRIILAIINGVRSHYDMSENDRNARFVWAFVGHMKNLYCFFSPNPGGGIN
jgi:hypothetical protein